MTEITSSAFAYMISRLVANANEAHSESDADIKDEFKAGRREAYYEMLDILQAELDARDADLKEFGLDFTLKP